MAKKEFKNIEYVTCTGCIFIQPLGRGLGYCEEHHVKMVVVIENASPCVWKKETDNNAE